jgi:hypothetical protein
MPSIVTPTRDGTDAKGCTRSHMLSGKTDSRNITIRLPEDGSNRHKCLQITYKEGEKLEMDVTVQFEKCVRFSSLKSIE